jgi:hypothetical protein
MDGMVFTMMQILVGTGLHGREYADVYIREDLNCIELN